MSIPKKDALTIITEKTRKNEISTVGKLIRRHFAWLPEEAIAMISQKVAGYVFGGEKYTTWEEVEKCLAEFWQEGSSEGTGRREVGQAECENCDHAKELETLREEVAKLKGELSTEKQRNKASAFDYSNKFKGLVDERNANLEKISVLEKSNSDFEKKVADYEKDLKAKDQSIAAYRKSLDNDKNLRDAKTKAELGKAEAEKAQKIAEEKERKARGELINAQSRISELENRLNKAETSGVGDSSSKSQLKKIINDLKNENRVLNVKLKEENEAKEKAIDEITSLKYSYNAKQVEKLTQERNDARELYKMATEDLDKINAEKNRQAEELKTARADLALEKRNNEALKDSLNAKNAATVAGILSDDGTLFYSEEMCDFVYILCERNMKRLETEKDVYRREYDLSKKLVEKIQVSPWQSKMSERIDNAVKTEDVRSLLRLGFHDAEGSKHEKLYYHNDPRYMLVVSSTPSDSNAWKACGSQVKDVLLFGSPKKVEKSEEVNA